ncbi:pyridoxal phosphate-dependent decarboxylase family protein [Fulvivirga sedimenti]|uniref:Aspartate aminotransferase family protein n=1 Tax=Fulvivirga sedimenti TaxID=2879465 RepID=A0A9X1HUF6_9BACT|nr:pyridoxal-dependent decarboxylase [Fulvivirga sedimenti]MCA6078508.1 aspartate aminotransferase family protein [Fulvivirga sedimenti]
MKYWQKLSQDQIKARVFAALDENVDYYTENILGVPASHLDSKVFNNDEPFLKEAPFLATLVHNPNHIGCHTLDRSESAFHGTQKIEREVIELCAQDILRGGDTDGYVAAGGTEANMQAIWIYRNYFLDQYKASLSEITILSSADTHYSVDKACDVFVLDQYKVAVDPSTRKILPSDLERTIDLALLDGKKYFIVLANMMTTMFGSVDDPDVYIQALTARDLPFRLHVDGAYGGFFYPFANPNHNLDFSNEHVTSVTLDAHKMVQAPYGTGIFLIRKGFMHYTNTREASYVEGEDYTLSGSRSGANAVAIWMILMKNGPYGWKEKILILLNRARWLCEHLDKLSISYFRNEFSNIVTIDSSCISKEIAEEFGLVPDNHHHPKWYKVVIMDHVVIERLEPLINRLAESR